MSDEPGGTSIGRPRTCRRFRIADAMILVGAVAMSLALSRRLAAATWGVLSWEGFPSAVEGARAAFLNGPGLGGRTMTALGEALARLVLLSEPLLATAAMAVIALQLVRPRPRPRRRRLFLQPGTVAACSTILALIIIESLYAAVWLATRKSEYRTVVDVVTALTAAPVFVSVSIASAWTVLLAAGIWRTEPTWIDRVGRILAFVWFAMAIFCAWRYLILGYSISSIGSFIEF